MDHESFNGIYPGLAQGEQLTNLARLYGVERNGKSDDELRDAVIQYLQELEFQTEAKTFFENQLRLGNQVDEVLLVFDDGFQLKVKYSAPFFPFDEIRTKYEPEHGKYAAYIKAKRMEDKQQ